MKSGLSARTLTLTIRYTGFDTYTRSKTLSEPTNLDSEIFATYQNLVSRTPKPEAKSAPARRCPRRFLARQRATRPARRRETRQTGKARTGYGRAPKPLRIRLRAIRWIAAKRQAHTRARRNIRAELFTVYSSAMSFRFRGPISYKLRRSAIEAPCLSARQRFLASRQRRARDRRTMGANESRTPVRPMVSTGATSIGKSSTRCRTGGVRFTSRSNFSGR